MPKIMIVDDDYAARDLIQFVLEQSGFEVTIASNGKEAIEKVSHEKPDLILMDIMMPIMDGIETTRRIKSSKETASIPIIMLSSLGKEMEVQQGLEAGAEAYLTKPFNPKDLVKKITEKLREGLS